MENWCNLLWLHSKTEKLGSLTISTMCIRLVLESQSVAWSLEYLAVKKVVWSLIRSVVLFTSKSCKDRLFQLYRTAARGLVHQLNKTFLLTCQKRRSCSWSSLTERSSSASRCTDSFRKTWARWDWKQLRLTSIFCRLGMRLWVTHKVATSFV